MEADAACIFFKAVLIPCKREAGILAKTDRIDARVLRAFAEAVTSCNLHPPEAVGEHKWSSANDVSEKKRKQNQIMKRENRITALAAALALFASGLTVAAATDDINPADFTTQIDNPFFPLQPGTTFIYKGLKEGSKLRDRFAVTDNTIVIDGVTCRVVHDKVFVQGLLEENTFDYFAQDMDGNVWYFGEDTMELDKKGRVVSTEGSWRAGVNGARPGIIMEAHPKVGDHYFQENAAPVAQDEATVLNLREIVAVPFGKFTNCLQTKEFTQLEPGNIEHKFYARGVGFIYGIVVKGGNERLGLVNIIRQP